MPNFTAEPLHGNLESFVPCLALVGEAQKDGQLGDFIEMTVVLLFHSSLEHGWKEELRIYLFSYSSIPKDA